MDLKFSKQSRSRNWILIEFNTKSHQKLKTENKRLFLKQGRPFKTLILSQDVGHKIVDTIRCRKSGKSGKKILSLLETTDYPVWINMPSSEDVKGRGWTLGVKSTHQVATQKWSFLQIMGTFEWRMHFHKYEKILNLLQLIPNFAFESHCKWLQKMTEAETSLKAN